MRNWIIALLLLIGFGPAASAQTLTIKNGDDPKLWPICNLGGAPIAAANGAAPAGVKVFGTKGGRVVMSQMDLRTIKRNDVGLITCKLRAGDPVYWMNNVLYDVASNQRFDPIGWEEDNRPPVGPVIATSGVDGKSITTTQLTIGGTVCPFGGVRFADGFGNTTYVCHGRDGSNGLNGASWGLNNPCNDSRVSRVVCWAGFLYGAYRVGDHNDWFRAPRGPRAQTRPAFVEINFF